MKKFFQQACSLAFFILLFQFHTTRVQAQLPRPNVSFQVFFDQLSPYGRWIEEPSYGYVWAPAVGADFRPYYTNGQWAMTDYGNTWVSNYDWGWAPFHYGRWTYDPYYRWVWIPDNEWAPAWVSWRGNDDYYGWAPLGPGVSLTQSFGNYYPPVDWWTFVPPGHLYDPRWVNYYPGYQQNSNFINNTTYITHTYNDKSRTYATGPRMADVQRFNKKIPYYTIEQASRPGKHIRNGNKISLYQPVVQGRGNLAPAKVSKAERGLGKPQSMHSVGRGKRNSAAAAMTLGKDGRIKATSSSSGSLKSKPGNAGAMNRNSPDAARQAGSKAKQADRIDRSKQPQHMQRPVNSRQGGNKMHQSPKRQAPRQQQQMKQAPRQQQQMRQAPRQQQMKQQAPRQQQQMRQQAPRNQGGGQMRQAPQQRPSPQGGGRGNGGGKGKK